MKDAIKRQETLESKLSDIQAEQKRREPYVIVRPLSILKDNVKLEFYPKGVFGKPEITEGLTLDDVLKWLRERPGMCALVSFSSCIEWLFAGIQVSDLYTEGQRRRFREEDCERYPEIKALCENTDLELVISRLARLPQTARFKI
ncbi:MAG: hypothetical protein LIO81_07895 [Clostridiales bacterium]|nr:hypothetical protein [Clostridiales bacterium]